MRWNAWRKDLLAPNTLPHWFIPTLLFVSFHSTCACLLALVWDRSWYRQRLTFNSQHSCFCLPSGGTVGMCYRIQPSVSCDDFSAAECLMVDTRRVQNSASSILGQSIANLTLCHGFKSRLHLGAGDVGQLAESLPSMGRNPGLDLQHHINWLW